MVGADFPGQNTNLQSLSLTFKLHTVSTPHLCSNNSHAWNASHTAPGIVVYTLFLGGGSGSMGAGSMRPLNRPEVCCQQNKLGTVSKSYWIVKHYPHCFPQVYAACSTIGRIVCRKTGGCRWITDNEHWKSQVRHTLYTSGRYCRQAQQDKLA